MTRPREARKKVSVLFIDIVDSTALGERLDPEPLHAVMDRYFAACSAAIATCGGAVEKFIGDAVMAAFGAEVAHEDDAMRAIRAAIGALEALDTLNAELAASHKVTLQVRCGICTGDVMVITTPGAGFRVVGDTASTASRLQTAAEPGQILVESETAAIVRGQAGLRPVPPLRLKGKASPVRAWQVTALTPEPDNGRTPPATPFIGRADELAELDHSFRRVTRGRQVCLVTMLGPPGIGKSRLVREYLASLPPDQVTVMSGRCSSYGGSVTYTPLADMLGTYPGGWPALSRLLSGDAGPGNGNRAARSLATIMRQPGSADQPSPAGQPSSAVSAPAGIEEIAWAVRHLLDVMSRTRPVIMVWEDLDRAESTLLDLIDDVATWLADVPVLLLCVARVELLEARPFWGGGKPCAMTLELGPLSAEQSITLVSDLVTHDEVSAHDQDDGLCLRIATQCDGNPLFAELMVDVFAEVAPSAQIPPTIHALLGARLDQLPADERLLLEMAAVIGREFTGDMLRAMAGADGITGEDVTQVVIRLVRRRIFRRAGPGTCRFAQALLRDTAYTFTPKARRERWHMFLGEWLAAPRPATPAPRPAPDGPDDEAALACAYHIEAACLLRRELRPGDPALPELAVTAAAALIREGMGALHRKDLPAAATLLERGRDLLPAGDPRHTSLALYICDCGIGLLDARRPMAALSAARDALAGDQRNTATCTVQRLIVELRLGLTPPEIVAADAALIAADLESDPGDDLSWCRLHQLQAYLHLAAERSAAADVAVRLGLARARAMNDEYEEDWLLCALCELAQWAPVNVRGALALCAELAGRFAANRVLLVPILVTRAHLNALAGDLDTARDALATARRYVGDLHIDLADAAVMATSGFVESLSGAHQRAEAQYRSAVAVLHAAEQARSAQALEADIARELFDQGETSSAAAALDRLEGDQEQLTPRAAITVAALRGRIAARLGQHEQALRHAGRAGELCRGTDDLCLAGNVLLDLAVVTHAAGRPAQAAIIGAGAVERFEAKGAALLAEGARAWLRTVGPLERQPEPQTRPEPEGDGTGA